MKTTVPVACVKESGSYFNNMGLIRREGGREGERVGRESGQREREW